MILSHRIQLDPTTKQRIAFAKASGCARYTWNWIVAQWKLALDEKRLLKLDELKKHWNQVKPSWTYESPKDANQQPFTHFSKALARARQNKANWPRFHGKDTHNSFYVSNDKFCVDGKSVSLPKIGRVRLTESLRFAGKIMNATIRRVADRWFISIQVETVDVRLRGEEILGVDLGIKTAITASNGDEHRSPMSLRKHLDSLKRLGRKHSAKQKGSQNRRKSAMKLALLFARIANIRHDFIHKATTDLCTKAKCIVVENLNVSGMMKNRKLSRAISDVGFYEIRRQLEYKSKLHGVELVIADRFYPSTKTCSGCGNVRDVSLSERIYTCDRCGLEIDRDLNASLNLCTLGLRGFEACGESSSGSGREARVKLDSTNQEPNRDHS